ncbi:unnamed protein product [Cladocopium goreaui]|uniref:Pentacotripeptide-repeat region of PRORP domain-containing protein n=1 Tax=Cladocopium goreaui TaxID=2562237 RepID=A0A9P1C060_9DINO|nr:unnamed protein product [Cladocopium goreaui]
MDLKFATLEPDPASLSAVLGACSRTTCWSEALQFWRSALPRDQKAESVAALAVAKGFFWNSALLSLTKLSSALHDWTGHWRMAMDDWQISQQRGVSVSTDFFNAAVSACSSVWRIALQLFGQATTFRIRVDQVCYAVALNACSSGQLWLEALSLLRAAGHVHSPTLRNDDLMMCFNTAMSCCESQLTWTVSLKVLQDLLQALVEADQKSYRSPLRTCGYGSGWRTAMSLLWRMTQGRTKDTDNSAFSAAVWAAEAWWNHWVHLRQVN